MEGKKMAEATKKKESRIKTWWTGVKAAIPNPAKDGLWRSD